MSDGPLLSVITVTLNCAAFLRRTIESIASQDYDNIELVVVDGGSTDGTLEVIRNAPTVSRWISEKDEGTYDAMNKGLQLTASNSRYVNFLNAGDSFHHKNVVREVMEHGHLDQHLYGNVVKGDRLIESPSKLGAFFLANHMVCHQAFFFKTPEHRCYPYDTQFAICADYKLLLDMVYAGEDFRKVDTTVVDFEASGTGISARKRDQLRQEKKAIRGRYPTLATMFAVKSVFSKFRSWGRRVRRLRPRP